MEEFDCVILGGGISSLMCAIELSKKEKKVLIISKTHPLRSKSISVSEGINFIVDKNDSIEKFKTDIINYSENICDKELVSLFCNKVKDSILLLDSYGVLFKRDELGNFCLNKNDDGLFQRMLFSLSSENKMDTGRQILNSLFEQIIKQNIPFIFDNIILDFVILNNRANGIILYDFKSGKVESIKSKSILVANEGYEGIFDEDINFSSSKANIHEILYEKGACFSNLDFLEPSTFNQLIGVGGITINENFNAVTTFDKSDKISGVFACGESIFLNVHFAKILPGNFLLEEIITPFFVCEKIIEYLNTNVTVNIEDDILNNYDLMIRNIKRKKGSLKVSYVNDKLKRIMRILVEKNTKHIIDGALNEVSKLKKDFDLIYIDDKSFIFNTQIVEYLELRNVLNFSYVVLLSLKERMKSETNKKKHILVKKDDVAIKINVVDMIL